MTVDAPGWDSDLSGHSAVVLELEDDPICHAVITDYLEGGEQVEKTECGQLIRDSDPQPREAFETPKYMMCERCWPDTVL